MVDPSTNWLTLFVTTFFSLLALVASHPLSSLSTTMTPYAAAEKKLTVMVTGANGYLASYIAQDLLEQGHVVHACVRDATQTDRVAHLQSLPGAKDRLHLFSTGDLAQANANTRPLDAPMSGCHAVIHSATPLSVKFNDEHNGRRDIYEPAVASTKELLACLERHASTVKCLVLTSSMAAVAPRPEPTIKDESCWSDPDDQESRENWYGCTKTTQEQLVRSWVREHVDQGELSQEFVYAAICPTMVVGPVLQSTTTNKNLEVRGTMGTLLKWCQGARTQAPNDSMSFIHVQDCAKMHTRILDFVDQPDMVNEHQRYMSLIESLHWNDILYIFKELYPALPAYAPYNGEDQVTPTQFNFKHMESLQVPVRSTKETLRDALEYLKRVGALA